jgi:gliding motility-associated-like protein
MTQRYRFLPLILTAALWLIAHGLYATHNRAGEIWVEQVGNCVTSLTVKAIVVTYTKASSTAADRDTLLVCWGDGTCDRVGRVNGPGNPPQGELLGNDIKRNYYIGFHTYSARGAYRISTTDPNRIGGILNVNYPNSDQVKFHISTLFTIPNPQFQGCNSTPRLLQPPIDMGCVGRVFTHNPNAFDPDGDSLSYHFIVPLQDDGIPVPNYQFPNQINPGPNNNLSIDERTGDIVWNSPTQAGEYNLAMIIVEYRNGIPIDTLVRDMQILVEECENLPPPVVTPFDEICVIAGELISFDVSATAPLAETIQKVRLTALGGPFEVAVSPATFTPDTNTFEDDPVVKTFTWQTACEHVSDQFYSVVFKAVDNYFGDSSGLATLKSMRIKVVGPPPQDVQAQPASGQVTVTWAKPYFCDNTLDNYFRGFTVWRREGSNNFPIDECVTGLEGRGYTKLTNIPIQQVQNDRYFYLDSNLERGRTYCYRILGEFARTTPGGQYTYNRVESLPSAEICVQLSRDLPLITHVDVQQTDATNGLMRVCWSKPLLPDLDTLLNPGPYRYEVLRAPGQTANEADFQPIGVSFDSPTYAAANDTCFVDNGLNTVGSAYSYLVNFYIQGGATLLGATNPASSVFLNISPTDNANALSWTETVPWNNYSYTVYRKNASGVFDSIATVVDPAYVDTGLVNGVSYCYKVKSEGSYGVSGIINPIENFSQESCATPIDNVPPCPPTLEVDNVCDELVNCDDEQNLFNTLTWVNPMSLCATTDDVVSYNIYYAPTQGADFIKIAFVDDSRITNFEHRPEFGIAGCYAVTALDSFANESPFSNVVCVDNCPFYVLPNAFTPNGDQQNDLFIPISSCFIESVEFEVFNRWGQLVFKTSDPALNWNGNNAKGEALATGTYFYTCRLLERRVSGISVNPNVLSGYIELIR